MSVKENPDRKKKKKAVVNRFPKDQYKFRKKFAVPGGKTYKKAVAGNVILLKAIVFLFPEITLPVFSEMTLPVLTEVLNLN